MKKFYKINKNILIDFLCEISFSRHFFSISYLHTKQQIFNKIG